MLYTGLENGTLALIDMTALAKIVETIDVGGRILGVAFGLDNLLYMANHGLGLQRLNRDGSVQVLVNEADGAPILFADELDQRTQCRAARGVRGPLAGIC